MLDNMETASTALHYFAPVGEKDGFLRRAQQNISPYLREPARLEA